MREILLNGVPYKLAPNGEIIKRQLNPFRGKLGAAGNLEFQDLSQASVEEYHDFRGGIGRESEIPGDSNRMAWSEGVDQSTPRSAVLGPLITTAEYPTWAVNTAYALLDFRIPTAPNGYVYECTTAGTSHATTEPTWPTTVGNTVADGTVTWTCRAYLASVKIIDFQSATYFIQNSRILKWNGTNLICVDNTFASPIDAIVVTDDTDEYIIVSSASAAIYSTDGTTWSTMASAPGGYMAVHANRLWFISTNGVTVTYSAYKNIDAFNANPAWTSPTGALDPDEGWTFLSNTRDDNTGTSADTVAEIPVSSWSPYLHMTFTEGFFDRVRFWEADGTGSGSTSLVDIDAFYDNDWYNLYEGGFAKGEWVTAKHGSTQKMSAVRFRFYNGDPGFTRDANLFEVDVGIGGDSFTLTGDWGTVYGLFEGKLLSDGSPVLYFHSNRGLFSIDVNAEVAYIQEVEYPDLTYAGHAAKYWNANLWVATGYGIKKIAPSIATDIGPDQDDGLPSGYQGIIYDMVTVNNWLVYCINGGTTDKSSILKRNASLGGNLQVYTTSAANLAIPCLCHSPSSQYTNGRLWWGEGTTIKYAPMPDTTSNVKQVSTYPYVATSSYMQLPIFRKMAALSKTALGVAAITKSCNANEYITVYYGLNGAAPTTSLGTLQTSPRPTILTFGSGLGLEFYRIQLAVILQRGGTNTLSPELESLLFYYYPNVVAIHSWTFPIFAIEDTAEDIIVALEALRDTNTLVPFIPTGDANKTSYNVKLSQMPMEFHVENQQTRQGRIQVTLQQVFSG